ncbi:hypothetical protein BYT27DRAFT_7265267 [Phlegmacium glaucopus]|nr:hypothetical protein BYT27DRAFT_7265267 [Phlegmacium glaucopus]
MNDCTLPSSGIVLHVWPGQWALPSFDPQCLAALLYLQLSIPGQFCVAECSYPDLSPTGQLPFLTHEQHVVAPCTSIIRYISGLSNSEHATYSNANLDAHLTPSEKSKRSAWSSHAGLHLGDLVSHTLYASNENWVNLTHPSLASMFPVPQKYYVPRRIRDTYIPRLEAVGLWTIPLEENTTEKSFQSQQKSLPTGNIKSNTTVSQAFQREKVTEKARAELEIYNQLLSGKEYVFQNRLSSLDVIIAAHILLLVNPPFPGPLIKDLINNSYPNLISYAQRVYTQAFKEGHSPIQFAPSSSSLWSLIPSWPKALVHSQKSKSQEDINYNRMSWSFIGLAIGSLAAYLVVAGSQTRKLLKRYSQEMDASDNLTE